MFEKWINVKIFLKESNKDVLGIYFDIIFVHSLLDETKIEALWKKLKFEYKFNYDCIMRIVDGLKKARKMAED